MRLARSLRSPLAPALFLTAALIGGGGSGESRLPWFGIGAVLAILVVRATLPMPRGLVYLAPLVALGLWCAASIAWSIQPDRSWSYANRSLLYAAVALLGFLLAPQARDLLYAAAAAFGLLFAWALLEKCLPWLYGAYGADPRLRAPVGNPALLGLLAALALPLALCLATRWRASGALLGFAAIVVLGLTHSRSAILIALLLAGAWMLLSTAWLDAAATLVFASLPAAAALAVAYSLPALGEGGGSHAERVRVGLIFLAVLLIDAAASFALARLVRPGAWERPARRRLAFAALAATAAAAGAAAAIYARRAWSGFRHPVPTTQPGAHDELLAWWKEAWHATVHAPLRGNGSGSFALLDERYRLDAGSLAVEPHDLPLQFLAESGAVGVLLLILALGTLVWASRRRRGPELALALLLPGFVLAGFLQNTWDVVAVAAPVLFVAGAMVARPATDSPRRASVFALLSLSGVAIALLSSLLAIWLGAHWSAQARARAADDSTSALQLVDDARSIDPLSLAPLFAAATAESDTGAQLGVRSAKRQRYALALGYLEKASDIQPHNPAAWYALGSFDLNVRRCPHAALPALKRFHSLDPHDARDAELTRAERDIRSGLYRC